MAVFKPIFMQAEIDGEAVAVQFVDQWMQIDPRSEDQVVTTCYLRPLEGPRALFVGTAVFSPQDIYEIPLYGKKLALARAIATFYPMVGWRECWKMARILMREWLKAEADREAVAAALQELERLEEARKAGTGLPAGPVSQFMGK